VSSGVKKTLVLLAVFAAGVGAGGVGGFVLNDYVERPDPDNVQQIQRHFEDRAAAEDVFSRLEQQARAQSSESGTDAPASAEEPTTTVPATAESPSAPGEDPSPEPAPQPNNP
jgi:hypothetical protein